MRFRPLRSASAPDASLAPVADPPADDARAVIDATGRPGALHAASVPVPSPCSASCSCASWPQASTRSTRRRAAARASPARSTRYPATLGLDFSGIVVRSPYESHPLPPGTPVFGMAPFPRSGGSYAEYAVVPSLSVARKPASLSHVEAAGVPLAALTAWGLVVETAHAHEGQRMLIHAGSGGVGHFAVQFAAYFGAHVTATARPQRHMAARTRRVGRDRLHHDAIRGCRSPMSTSSSTSSATSTRRPAAFADGAAPRRPVHPGADRFVARLRRGGRRRGRAGDELQGHPRRRCAGDHRPPAGLGRGAGLHRPGVRPDGCRRRPRELEKGHTRGKIVLRVSDD